MVLSLSEQCRGHEVTLQVFSFSWAATPWGPAVAPLNSLQQTGPQICPFSPQSVSVHVESVS